MTQETKDAHSRPSRDDDHDDKNVCRVHGRVTFADGQPAKDAEVVVLVKRLRCKDEPLAKTTKTKKDGQYLVEYACAKVRLDLYVRATLDQGVVASPLIMNAGRDETVDLVFGGEYVGPSDYERVQGTLSPVLHDECGGDGDLAELDENEVALLSAKTGMDPTEVVLQRQSAALAKETKLSPVVFYALGRQKVPLGLTAVLATDPDRRRAAVTAALAENQIPPKMEKEAFAALKKLDELTVTEALREPKLPGESTLGSLLGAAGLAAEKRATLATTYAKHEGSNEAFWKQVRSGKILTKEEADRVQDVLQLGAITLNHVPLVQALLQQKLSKPKDLAKLEPTDWLALVRTKVGDRPIGIPPDLTAAGIGDVEYVNSLFAIAEDAFPTAMIAHRAERLPSPGGLTQFFSRNPEFELRSTPVSAFLREKPEALDWIEGDDEKARFVRNLKGVERTFRIAPVGARVETMALLLGDGIDSAQKIRTMGRAAFLRRYGEPLGYERARSTFARASNAAATAAILIARHGTGFDKTPMQVLPKRATSVERFPDYETLFGSLDFCSCEHCQSVYSPSAYLVDALHWLEHREATIEEGTALDVLLAPERRADLGTIELSCENTNTPLPYIDLVNEVLEAAVAPQETAPRHQTRGSASDLLIQPEHLLAEAYRVLAGTEADGGRDAVYPFNLPFNLWLAEARVYLGQLGVPRHALMEAFHAGGDAAAFVDPAVATEAFGMSPLEWDLIADEPLDPVREPQSFWGLEGDVAWVDELATVSTLLEKATPPLAERGMQYEELGELLRTDFLQAPEQELGVWFDGGTCDTSRARLIGLSADHLGRLHRFIRLRRRVGWSAADLDRAIQVLGGGALDEGFLLKLAVMRRLQGELTGIDLAELLTWWGPLDTRRWARRLVSGRPPTIPPEAVGLGFVFHRPLGPQAEKGEDQSFYDRLFLSRGVAVLPSPVFRVRPDGTALLDETQELAEHSPAIAAALGITAADLALVVALLPDTKLSLANLSALHRRVSLARALDVPISDLLSLIALTGLDPFDPARPADALLFVEEARLARASGLSIGELDYVLRHVDTKPAALEPRTEELGVSLLDLRDGLRKVHDDHAGLVPAATADELRDRFTRDLAALLPAAQVIAAIAVVDLEPGAAPPADAAQVIADSFVAFLDVAAATSALAEPANPAYLDERTARLRFVLGPLIDHRRHLAADSTAIDKVSTLLGLDPAVAAPLLREYVRHPGPAGTPALEIFQSAALIGYDAADPDTGAPILPTHADLPEAFEVYARLHKVALLVSRLHVTKDETRWVFEQGPASGTLDINTLPVAAAPGPVPYPAWARLRDAIALRDRVSGGRLFDLFEAAARAPIGDPARLAAAHEALLVELERRTRWNRADIEYLVGVPARGGLPAQAGALGLQYPADWKDERGLKRVDTAMAVVRRVGLAAETLWPWRETPLLTIEQDRQAQAIKQAVRARYEDSQWRAIARPLRDRLREWQRDALTGWLVAHDGRFTDANDLFAQLLIDVQMSSCQLTSRIKQGISSVQLFVQRALMNLEPKIKLSVDDAREWKWMKNYRVWEANRKVFLYPENWIEPELRDDKTPFFRDLESELLQSEVTDASAEQAMLGYLDRLDEVARLEVVGVFHQKQEETNILHVFGRTRGTPARYFYRQRVDETRWTPWERVEVDIEGDHLIPIVYNRRLYVFWTQITEVAVEEVVDTPSGGGNNTQKEPEKYYQLRLGWSERKSTKWASKKLSIAQIGGLRSDYERLSCGIRKSAPSKRSDFFFRIYEDSATEDLLIEPIRFVRAESKKASDFYVKLDRFRMSGCDGTVTLEPRTDASQIPIRVPSGSETANQSFASADSGGGLSLPARNPVTGAYQYQRALGKTQGRFDVVPARVDDFRSQAAFFFQDLKRTFFVEPHDTYRWVRRPPIWTFPDRIPIDIPRLYPDLRRPLPPQPDPWILDKSGVVRDSSPIRVKSTPPLVGTGGTRVAGLPALGAAGLADTFGSRVAYVGAEPVVARSNKIAVLGKTDVIARDGRTLFSLRSAGAPAEAATLRSLTMETQYTIPALVIDELSIGLALKTWGGKSYRFEVFYHPYASVLMRQLNRFGIDGLLDPSPTGPEPLLRRQQRVDQFFQGSYSPAAIELPYPRDEFDFSYGGAYAAYNWEAFFHVPFAIACWLSKNQRFEEAQRWFHYIFDPTEASSDLPAPQRFWKVRPFFELFHEEDVEAGPIHELLLLLQYDGSDPDKLLARDRIIAQVAEWRKKPFSPHALARLRLAAYQKAVVMKYIDNLIEWGDSLFRRDTMESINEATQLYVLAAQILGRKPQEVKVEPPQPRTFNQLRQIGLDELSNALVEEVEGFLPEVVDPTDDRYDDDVPLIGPTLFFCVPPNEKLLTGYWDRVADRLFKLHHCMNIEGLVRQLALFEPPIDPALLVRAAAAGLDLVSALSDLNAPLPHYRYQALVQRANELCNEVRALGQALLAALEKKDAEKISLLRADNEVKLQLAMRQARERQVDEAKETMKGLEKSKENADLRTRYYRSRTKLNEREKQHLAKLDDSRRWQERAEITSIVANALAAIPNFSFGVAGFGGSPQVTTSLGGANLSAAAQAIAAGFQMAAAKAGHEGQKASINASYDRRMDDWVFQGDVAGKESESIEKQILAAQIRVAIAERDLQSLDLQTDQSREVAEFLRSKYTNEQLYTWMVGQLSALYFQSYQLAYDIAKRAERAWQFELAQPDRSFVQFGYWDGLKKGLLAGERLAYDLHRMEAAYLDTNRREYELTRHVSLRRLDPVALVKLRSEGACLIRIPEAWFDLDSPGHYLRRLKTVSISLPSVTGPFVPVRCTLTLLSSSVRTVPDPAGAYPRSSANDPRFVDDAVGIQSVVTSRAQEDGGLFETNLRDERYLPFEGAGAVSEWRIELPKQFRQFDYDTISDAILHLRYTARDGGNALRQAAEDSLTGILQALVLESQEQKPAGAREGLLHLVSARQELPDAWHRFLHPSGDQTDQGLPLPLLLDLLPQAVQGSDPRVVGLDLFLAVNDVAGYAAGAPVRLQVLPPGAAAQPVDLTSVATDFDGLPHGLVNYGQSGRVLGGWSLQFRETENAGAASAVLSEVNGHLRLNSEAVRDLIVVLRYRVA